MCVQDRISGYDFSMDNNLMLMIFVFFRLYEATIEEILDDGACTVTFNDYGNTDVTQVSVMCVWCVCVYACVTGVCACVCMRAHLI